MTITHDFELIVERQIPEIKTRASLYRHVPTGAQLLSLSAPEENKVFGITFRTPPADSTGVAHIMEHAVLCGSEKYPVKEPFVELVKGSLNTFLNAMTYPDKTCYPVASQNLQDFYNLIDVYMDAVFHPLIPPHTLQQEGWHYEIDDADGALSYKGIVFNEMKGAYSSPENLLGRNILRSLFPATSYAVDSGGDPRYIPDLTYAQFKSFHATYYHPSNSFIFFYGDDDPEERLRLMQRYLQGYSALQVESAIPLQPAFDQPLRQVYYYDTGNDADEMKGMATVNWLLPDSIDQERTLGLNILAYILIGTPASPLYKTLIDSGLGEDLTGSGLEDDLRQLYFSTGLKGVAVNSVAPANDAPDGESAQGTIADYARIEALILETLDKLAQEGIDPETVAAALNTVEFRRRENNTGSFPRGLVFMLRSLSEWLYDGDPLEPLAFEAPLQTIKSRVSGGERYFENLIQEYLLANPHRTTVILHPQPGLRQLQEQEEQERLTAVRAALSPAELQTIQQQAQELRERQETPDTAAALATIPMLALADLERQNKLIPRELIETAGDGRLLFHDLDTTGIVYLDLGLDLHLLPQESLPYAGLFGRLLLEMGTLSDDFVRFSQRIGRTTGGVHPAYYVSAMVAPSIMSGGGPAATWLFLRGKATMDHTTDLLAILREALLTTRLDNPERFRQIVLEEKAGMEAALAPAGHRLVNTRLRSFFGESGWVDEQMSGVSWLYFLRRLAEQIEGDWPGILARLEEIRSTLVNRSTMLANVTLDAPNWDRFRPKLIDFLHSLPGRPALSQAWKIDYATADQGLVLPAQVNYVGKGANLYDLGYELDGSYIVINNYLGTTWLWEKVRVQGGAYGGFVLFDHRSGVLTYLSYRDPNLVGTLEIFDGSGDFLRHLDGSRLSQEELTKSIIGAIGDLDVYQFPDAKGFSSLTRYLAGDTDADRQKRREEILDTTLADFHAYGEALARARQASRVVAGGAEQALQAANAQGLPLVIEKVL